MKKLLAILLFVTSLSAYSQTISVIPSYRVDNPVPNPLDSLIFTFNGKPDGYSSFYTGRKIRSLFSGLSSVYVPQTRLVSTGYGLLGGGNLGSNLTLSVDTSVLRTVSNSFSKAQISSGYQPLNAKLTAISALANGNGALINNGSGTFSYNPFTGTGNIVRSASPTLTGTVNVSAISASNNITASGTLQGNGLTITGATNPALQINSGVGGYSRFTFSENNVNKYLFGYNHSGSDSKFGFFDYGSNTWPLYWNGTVDGNTTLFASNARPNANNTYDLGGSSYRWKDFYSGTGDFSGAVTSNSFIKSGGTSSQFLMADGSVNSNSYATTALVNSKADSIIVDNPTGLAQGIASNNASFLLLTDSFGLGAGATSYNKGFSSIVTQSIQNASGSSNTDSHGYTSIINMQYQLSSGTGITTTGSLVNTGLVEKRLELTAGETITITNRTYRYADVFYDASLSSGTLTFRLNGNIVATKTLSGTGIQNTSGGSSTPMVALETLPTDTLTITASATAIVTAIIVLREPTFSPPITYVASQGGTLFSDYSTSAKMDEIAYYLNYASRERRYVALALGTNSIYGAYQETPASMIANAKILIAGINSRSTAPVNYILTAPAKANEAFYPTLPGYTYEDYIQALVTFCDSAHYELIRYDLTPMGLGSDTYLDDHLHPNDLGYSIIANAWTQKLNIPTNPNTTVSTRSNTNYLPKAAGTGNGLTGALYLNAGESDVVSIASDISDYLLVTPGVYTGIRQGTDKSFNIDTYNDHGGSGGQINALKLTQTGVLSVAGGLASGTAAVTPSANDNSTKVATTAYVDRLIRGSQIIANGEATIVAGTDYSYTGAADNVYLPAVSSTNKGGTYSITFKNRGSGTMTIYSYDGVSTQIYTSSAVASTTLATGAAITFMSDGTYWNVE